MKKVIFLAVFVFSVSVFGQNVQTIFLEPGEKLVNVTWLAPSAGPFANSVSTPWVLTRPMGSGELAESYVWREYTQSCVGCGFVSTGNVVQIVEGSKPLVTPPPSDCTMSSCPPPPCTAAGC